MSRVVGPVCRMCRREQTKLFLKGDKCYTKCILEKRPTPPGMAKPARGKPSAYAVRLREKQKLRRKYLSRRDLSPLPRTAPIPPPGCPQTATGQARGTPGGPAPAESPFK